MLTRSQLRHYRTKNEQYMMDQVVYLAPSYTTGTYGERVTTYSTTATFKAGLAFSPFKFRARELSNQVVEGVSEVLVRARLPQDALNVIQPEGRLVLTKKWGETLTASIEFEVQGVEEFVVNGLIYNLKRLEN